MKNLLGCFISILILLNVSFATSVATELVKYGAAVKPLPELFAPKRTKSDPYVLKYLESRADDHLDLNIKTINGTILLSDNSKISLKGCTYTINGWTDPDDCSRLQNEPIRPYTVYHVTKTSIDAPMREWWRTIPEIIQNNPITAYRSEVFFVVVPQGEKWNGVGEDFNPIGRPLAFSELPAFKLKTRVYGFEAIFSEETSQRLDELDITFNRRQGQSHRMLYTDVLSRFIKEKGYYKEPRKALHDFDDEDCIAFADSLPLDAFLAFDIEPSEDMRWAIDYTHPNYVPVISKIITRLGERGAKAYCWMGSTQALYYKGENLDSLKEWGKGNEKLPLYIEAYANANNIDVGLSPNAIGLVGAGYDCYDYNFLPNDKDGRNSSPQAMYLKTLDACSMLKRVEPAKDLLSFVWGRMEYYCSPFPTNFVVDIPKINAQAQVYDNKPSYPPSYWQDNLTLMLLYCRYLFSWEPGIVSWNPVNITRYAQKNVLNGEIVTVRMLKGDAPKVTGGMYRGVKGSTMFNSTIGAAYRYSLIQDVCDEGKLMAVPTMYRRVDRFGKMGTCQYYLAYNDGSQFVNAAMHRQPFTLVVKKTGSKRLVVFFQDVWSRPGRWTDFSFEFEGKTYAKMKSVDGKIQSLRTNGNRLFIGIIE